MRALSVAAAVEGMSLTSRGSHEPQPEMPPGVGNAPDVQGTASDVVEGEKACPPRRSGDAQIPGAALGRSSTLMIIRFCSYQVSTTTLLSSPTTHSFWRFFLQR